MILSDQLVPNKSTAISKLCVDAMDGMVTIIWYEGLCGWTEVEITLTAS